MVDSDAFLTTLYVMVDDFCQCLLPRRKPGPQASLSESEVVTLALFAQWSRFSNERDFYRYATSCLRGAFPTLPDRSQFNRLARHHLDLIEAVALHLVEVLEAQECPYEALDSSAMPVLETSSAGAKDGWPVVQTLDGPTAWAGTRVSAGSLPLTQLK